MTANDSRILIATPSRVYGYPPLEPHPPAGGEQLWRATQVGPVLAWAGLDGQVAMQCPAGEHAWRIDDEVSSLLIVSTDPPVAWVGTVGPHIYRIACDGSLRRIDAFDALPQRRHWSTPWGGPPHVRSLAMTPDGWIYADVEVGSIMVATDAGQSWHEVDDAIHPDVHQVLTIPTCPDRLYTNGRHGVYVSEDRGHSWLDRAEGLGRGYGRAIAVPWDDPLLMLATISDGPHDRENNVHGRLFRTTDGGHAWQRVLDGLPPTTPRNINTHHVIFTPDATAWLCEGDRVHVSEDRGRTWHLACRLDEEVVMLSAVLDRQEGVIG